MSGIGCYGDLGNLQIIPTVGETDLRSGTNAEVPFSNGTLGWRSEFSHDEESAKAGYYSVLLKRYGILAEATASLHTGTLRFTYPKGSDRRVIFNFSRRIAGHADSQSVKIVRNRRIEGHIHCTPRGGGFGRGSGKISYDLYFICELSEPARQFRFFESEKFLPENIHSADGSDLGMIAFFDETSERPLVINVGISYVDAVGTAENLKAESDASTSTKKSKTLLTAGKKPSIQ